MPKPIPLTDAECELRSAYMRLYRAYIEGAAYYPALFIRVDIAAELRMQNHIAAVGSMGFRLTESGVAHWRKLANIKAGGQVGYAHINRRGKLRESA